MMFAISDKKRRAFFFTPATVGLFLVLLMMAAGPLNAFAGEYDDDYEECEDFDAYYFLNGEGGCVSVYDKPDGRERVRLYNGLDVEYQFGKNEGSAWKHIRIIGYYDLGMLGYVREEDLEDCTYRSGYRVLWRTDYANEFCEAELTSDTALSGMDGERIGFLFAGVRLLVVGETENDYFVLIRNSATAGLVPKDSVVISQNRYTMNAELNMINDASVNNKDGEACIYPTCEIETEEWNCYPLSAGDRIAIFYHVSGGWSFVGHLSSIGIVKYTGFIEDRYIVSPEQQSTTFLSSMDENMNTRFLSETGDHASDKIRYVSPSVPTHRVLLRPAENSSEYIAKLNAGTPVYIISEGSKWCYGKAGDATGYIMTQYLQTNASGKPLYARTTEEIEPAGTEITIPADTTVSLLSSHDDKVCFMTPDGDVYSACISCFVPQDNSMDIMAKVTSDSLRFRVLPNKNAGVITSIGKGKKVVITILGDTWSQIRYQDTIGYVMTKYLEINTKYIKDTI